MENETHEHIHEPLHGHTPPEEYDLKLDNAIETVCNDNPIDQIESG